MGQEEARDHRDSQRGRRGCPQHEEESRRAQSELAAGGSGRRADQDCGAGTAASQDEVEGEEPPVEALSSKTRRRTKRRRRRTEEMSNDVKVAKMAMLCAVAWLCGHRVVLPRPNRKQQGNTSVCVCACGGRGTEAP